MKLQSKKSQLESNNQNQGNIKLKIGNIGKILGLLRDGMYSNPIQVLVQEYVSNAIDIHNEQGQKKKFEITLPTITNPIFMVRDFGSGLSEEQMENVYTQYGVSTKDKDNTQQGGFGLGCKSFWSYTKSFFVKTYYNGIATEYLAHLGESEEGDFKVISREETNEPNGLAVYGSVQKEDFKKFEEAVLRCTLFIKNKPVIKGWIKEPEWITNLKPELDIDGIKFYDKSKFDFYKNSYNAKPLLVVENVIYTLNEELSQVDEVQKFLSLCKDKTVIVFQIPIGELDITPSRDNFRATKKTNANIAKVFKDATDKLIDYAEKKSKECNSLNRFMLLSLHTNVYINVEKYLKYTSKEGFYFTYSNSYRSKGHIQCNELMKDEKALEVFYSRNRKGKLMFKKNPILTLGEDSLNSEFYYATGEETLKWSRLQYRLNQLGQDKSIVLIHTSNDLEVKFWKRELGVKALADLPKPPTSFTQKNKKAKDKVCIHYVDIQRWSNEICRKTVHVNLSEDTISSKHLYFSMDGNKINYDELPSEYNLKDFKNEMENLGFKLCSLSKGVVNNIKDNDLFISIVDLLENPLQFINKEDCFLNYHLRKNLDYTINDNCNYLLNLNLNDDKLCSLIKEYTEIHSKIMDNHSEKPPVIIYDMLEKEMDKEINYIQKITSDIENKLNEYPLFSSSELNKQNLSDFEIYFNAKYQCS